MGGETPATSLVEWSVFDLIASETDLLGAFAVSFPFMFVFLSFGFEMAFSLVVFVGFGRALWSIFSDRRSVWSRLDIVALSRSFTFHRS